MYIDKPIPGLAEIITVIICLILDIILFIHIYKKTGFNFPDMLSVPLYIYVILLIFIIFPIIFTLSMYTTKYVITDSTINVSTIFMKKDIPIKSISEIRRFNLINDLYNQRSCAKIFGLVTIVLKKGFIKKYVISPENPDEFIEQVSMRMEKMNGKI